MKISGFDWDSGNRAKCEKHGLKREQVEAFFNKKIFVAPDPKHSQTEARFLALGRIDGRPVFVAFTFRLVNGLRLIRPISARYMHKKEILKYEKAFAKIED